jgi:hypothetical protein
VWTEKLVSEPYQYLQTSEGRPYSFPAPISVAMYRGVPAKPSTSPVFAANAKSRQFPRSNSLTVPFSSNPTFDGFRSRKRTVTSLMSRWKKTHSSVIWANLRPRSCKYSMADAIPTAIDSSRSKTLRWVRINFSDADLRFRCKTLSRVCGK